MPADAAEIVRLAEKVERLAVSHNEVDVLVEIALFKPDIGAKAVRANAAGTKVIYTDQHGKDHTHRAQDWTFGIENRRNTAAALRARAAQHDHEVG